MAYTLDISLALGLSKSGLSDLRAQLVDTTGANVGSAVSMGFVEIGTSGNYLWHYAAFPDSHRGGVKFYSNAAPTVFLAFVAINPEEAENTDSKISAVAAAVWAVGTRTLTGFGTLVADIWANVTRTITGGTITTNSDKTGYALSAAGVQAIWDALTSALTTVGSIGKLLVDNINATISSRLASASYTAPDNATITAIQADTDDIQTRLPAALVSGRMDSSVGAMAANVLTATAIAADAITDAKVASDVTIASVTGSVGSVTGNVGGSVASVTGNVAGSVASVTGNVGGNVVGSVGSVTAGVTVTTNNDKTGYGLSAAAVQAIWDALTSALTTVGSIGKRIVDNLDAAISSRMATFTYTTPPTVVAIRTEMDSNSTKLANLDAAITTRATPAQVNTEADTALSDVGLTTTVTGRIDAAITSRASQASVDTVAGYIDTEVAAIKAKTDNLPSDPADASDIAAAVAAIQSDTNDLQVQIGTAGAGLTAIGDTRIATINTNVASILAQTGTSGVALSTATLQAIADAILKRGASHVDGASPEENSLYELIEAVLQSNTATGAWLIYRTDGTTLFNTRSLITDVDAEPIVGAS